MIILSLISDKQRTEYERDDVVTTIDRIDGLITFVEMEGILTAEKGQRFDPIIECFDLNRKHRVRNKGNPDLIIEDQN